MDRRSKVSVGIVMGFAAVGSISSILRMVYLKGLLFSGSVSSKSKFQYPMGRWASYRRSRSYISGNTILAFESWAYTLSADNLQ